MLQPGEIREVCPRCGLATVTPETGSADQPAPAAYCEANINANICRQCPSGRYQPATDTCGEVIDRGKAKKQNRGGKINWLHFNRGCPCPLGHFEGLDL